MGDFAKIFEQAALQTDVFDDQNFFDLMQSYRIAPMERQDLVIRRYEKAKTYIREQLKETSAKFLEWVFEEGYQPYDSTDTWIGNSMPPVKIYSTKELVEKFLKK